eukprot:5502548-Pleurochrysis_carterae.AAC.1
MTGKAPKDLHDAGREGVAPAQGASILRPDKVRHVAQDVREQPRLSVCKGKQCSCGRDRRL